MALEWLRHPINPEALVPLLLALMTGDNHCLQNGEIGSYRSLSIACRRRRSTRLRHCRTLAGVIANALATSSVDR
jgi:hypothetical protein